MAQVSVVARITAQPGKAEELVEAAKALVKATEEEVGTEVYVLNRSDKEPDVFWLYELYRDREALGVHGKTDAMAAFVGRLGDLSTPGSQIHVLSPVVAKGLALD